MCIKKIISITVVFIALTVVAEAQPLSVLIDTAMSRNPALRYRKADYLAALERVPQVNRLPDPEVGVGGFILPVETRTGAQRFRLSATQMAPWFGTLQAREDLVVAQAQTMLQPVQLEELKLVYEIKRAYLELYETGEMEEIIQRSLGVLRVLRSSIMGQIESGQGSTADVLRLDLKIRELEQQLGILETERSRLTADLNRFMYRTSGTPIEVVDSFDFAEIPMSRDTLLSHIMEHHPAIRRFVSEQEVSRKAIELNEKDRKPMIGVGMDYIFITPRTDAQPERNGRDVVQVKAMVTVPIHGGKYDAKQREEELRIESLESQKLDAAAEFVANVDKAIAEHRSAELAFELYLGQIEITKAAIRILETDYSTSGNNFDDLLRLEMELIDYDMQLLNAIVRSQLAIAAIELYLTNLN